MRHLCTLLHRSRSVLDCDQSLPLHRGCGHGHRDDVLTLYKCRTCRGGGPNTRANMLAHFRSPKFSESFKTRADTNRAQAWPWWFSGMFLNTARAVGRALR